MKVELEFDQNYWDKMQQIVNTAVENKISALKSKSETGGTITVQEAAKYFNVAEITVHDYIRKVKLPAKKIGRKYIIEEADVRKALSEVKSLKYQRA